MAYLLHFKDDGTKNKIKTVGFFIVLSFTRSNVLYYPTFLSHFHIRQSVSFDGTTNMHILASGPELQAVRFGYVILGEN